MIQNTAIIEKLETKTKNDPVLKELITNILEVEVQGKNYKKFYDSELNSALKKRGN